MSWGGRGDLLKVSVTSADYKQTQALMLKVVGCGYVESHETEVPFTHMPKFHISDHKEFLKSNGVECTEDDNGCYRNVCKMSVVSFALAVVFIIRLFSTSVFRVPKWRGSVVGLFFYVVI